MDLRSREGQRGFTLVELIMVVAVMSVLVGVGALELAQTRSRSFMDNGALQVEKTIKEAYSIAQNERVPVTLNFYAFNNTDDNKKNCYEILRGTYGSGTSMKPPIGVSYTKIGSNYYCKLLEGAQPKVSADVVVYFNTRGSDTRCEDPSTGAAVSRTVTLTFPGLPDKTVSVNSEGQVTP